MAAFTPNQTTYFFMNGPKMSIPTNIRTRLFLEGIVNIDDFDDFKEYQLNEAFKNMCTSISGITVIAASGRDAAVLDVAPVPTVIISAKCALRLKVALISYH